MSQKTYRIGEAAAKLNLKSYVLRFWETEFPQIEPIRTDKGQRLYSEKDLMVLSRIRFLLHERGLTIDGARRLLAEEAARGTLFQPVGGGNGTHAGPDLSFKGQDDAHGAGASASPLAAEAPPAAVGSATPHPPVSAADHALPAQASLSGQALPLQQARLFPEPPREGEGLTGRELHAVIAELSEIHQLLASASSGDVQ